MAMDWQAILDVALSDGVNAKRVDFMSNALIQLIPDQPSKKADAEWLKERGWVTGPDAQNPSWRFSHPTGDLDMTFHDDDAPRLFVFGEREIPNPTRMTVALFEAAVKASIS